MSKKVGTKTRNIYHRKDYSGDRIDVRITCKSCGTKHYKARYHYCVYRPNLLDLYSCAGGAGYGYYRAGFNITGVDIKERRNYFGEFILSDAIEFIQQRGPEYDFIHASPPCQLYSKATSSARKAGITYPDLVEATRVALIATGRPFVIENVPQAPLRKDLVLRGEMFGLKVIRKRVFEFGNCELSIKPPAFSPISVMKGEAVIVYGSASFHPTGHGNWGDPGRKVIVPEWKLDTVRETWQYAMGLPFYMTENEIAESIPPAYTEFIGNNIKSLILNKCPIPVK